MFLHPASKVFENTRVGDRELLRESHNYKDAHRRKSEIETETERCIQREIQSSHTPERPKDTETVKTGGGEGRESIGETEK